MSGEEIFDLETYKRNSYAIPTCFVYHHVKGGRWYVKKVVVEKNEFP